MSLHKRIADQMREVVAGSQSSVTQAFLAEWPHDGRIVERAPAVLRVLNWLPQLLGGACDRTEALTRLVVENAYGLDWRQTYTPAEFGPGFLERYGWTEIIGERGVFVSDRIAAGILMLGPDVEYPTHSHDAEEIYVPLSGIAEWAQGSDALQNRRPGELIHHPSGMPHAMKTGREPLLALYVWRAGNLTQKSVIAPRRK